MLAFYPIYQLILITNELLCEKPSLIDPLPCTKYPFGLPHHLASTLATYTIRFTPMPPFFPIYARIPHAAFKKDHFLKPPST